MLQHVIVWNVLCLLVHCNKVTECKHSVAPKWCFLIMIIIFVVYAIYLLFSCGLIWIKTCDVVWYMLVKQLTCMYMSVLWYLRMQITVFLITELYHCMILVYDWITERSKKMQNLTCLSADMNFSHNFYPVLCK